jgi:hypothetical protein
LDQAQTRSNMMNRALKQVEALPEELSKNLLPVNLTDTDDG